MKNSTKIKILQFVRRTLNVKCDSFIIDQSAPSVFHERRIEPVTLRCVIEVPEFERIPKHIIETDISRKLADKMIEDGYISFDTVQTSRSFSFIYKASVQIIKPSDRYDND